MTVPANDGCLWPLDPGCLEDTWESDYDEPTKLRAQALASNTLRRLCAYRVGGCPKKVRPCGSDCGGISLARGTASWARGGFWPTNWNGTWSNCTCSGPCRHNPSVAIKLPPPVYGVSEVKVDGVVVSTSAYWVSDGYLIRTDGGVWPTTQNLDKPDTAVGTFSVTYLDSAPVDGQGAYAAARLALEFAKACKTGKCELPKTVTNIVRQGVTFSLPTGAFPGGETGIREVDAFIALWNPEHRTNRTKVWVP